MVTRARAEVEGLEFKSPQPHLFFTLETPLVPVPRTETRVGGIGTRTSFLY
jgi:hypothetical protein